MEGGLCVLCVFVYKLLWLSSVFWDFFFLSPRPSTPSSAEKLQAFIKCSPLGVEMNPGKPGNPAVAAAAAVAVSLWQH